MDKTLNGCQLLLTRPSDAAQSSSDFFTSRGADVVSVPLLEIAPLHDADTVAHIQTQLSDLKRYDYLIFISQNAVRFALDWFVRLKIPWPAQKQCFAIGQTTATVLQTGLQQLSNTVEAMSAKAAVPTTSPTTTTAHAMTSEALLQLPELNNSQGKRILIFRGQGGRAHLQGELERFGATVTYCELYQRCLPNRVDVDALREFADNHTLSTHRAYQIFLSGETLNNLERALAAEHKEALLEKLKTLAAVLPSQRVAEQARHLGFHHPIVASNATDPCIAEAIYDWRQRHTCEH